MRLHRSFLRRSQRALVPAIAGPLGPERSRRPAVKEYTAKPEQASASGLECVPFGPSCAANRADDKNRWPELTRADRHSREDSLYFTDAGLEIATSAPTHR